MSVTSLLLLSALYSVINAFHIHIYIYRTFSYHIYLENLSIAWYTHCHHHSTSEKRCEMWDITVFKCSFHSMIVTNVMDFFYFFSISFSIVVLFETRPGQTTQDENGFYLWNWDSKLIEIYLYRIYDGHLLWHIHHRCDWWKYVRVWDILCLFI